MFKSAITALRSGVTEANKGLRLPSRSLTHPPVARPTISALFGHKSKLQPEGLAQVSSRQSIRQESTLSHAPTAQSELLSPPFAHQLQILKPRTRIEPPAGLIEDTLHHSVDVLSSTFENDPFMRYFQLDDPDTEQTEKLSYSYLQPVMHEIMKSFVEEENATLVRIPGRDVTSAWSIQTVRNSHAEDVSSLPPAFLELLTLSSHALRSSLPLGQHYIHFIVVGNRDPGRGIVSGLVRPMFQMANELGLPVYGEATNERSRDVHEHLGMVVGDVFWVGKGRVGRDGMRKVGGEGVPHWPCLYLPSGWIR